MHTKKMMMMALSFSIAAAAATACTYEEDEPSMCEIYCETAGECHTTSDQMFSGTECLQDCQTSLERHASVGCQKRYADLMECVTDLPCASWNDFGSACAYEIDYLDMCVEGEY